MDQRAAATAKKKKKEKRRKKGQGRKKEKRRKDMMSVRTTFPSHTTQPTNLYYFSLSLSPPPSPRTEANSQPANKNKKQNHYYLTAAGSTLAAASLHPSGMLPNISALAESPPCLTYRPPNSFGTLPARGGYKVAFPLRNLGSAKVSLK